MAKNGSLYITISSDGIWYYQRWMPKKFRSAIPSLKAVFRISLRTKNKREAIRLSRIISVKIDKLALDHFESPEDFARAMKLMYEAAQHSGSFEDYEENFLWKIEDTTDEWFFAKGSRFNNSVQEEFKKLRAEVTFLKEALLNGQSISSPEAQEKLLGELADIIKPPLNEEQNPTIDTLFDLWKENKIENLKRGSFETAYKPAIELFIRFVKDFEGGQLSINNLAVEHIRHYQKYFKDIPSRAIPANFSISELINLKGKPKSPATILGVYANVGTFLSWILLKGYPINGNLQKILVKGSDITVDAKRTKQRLPFTDEDLEKLFNSKAYTTTKKFKTSAMYWAPLISLFSGARMSEILQLECHDIKDIDGVWVMDIDDLNLKSADEDKRVKKDGSRRVVPIHKQLIKLGFIKYYKEQKDRLFPDETRNTKGRFDRFQKRFATYRKQVNVMPQHEMIYKDFHTFRHTVRTRLTEIRSTGKASQRFDQGIIDGIVGHASSGRSIGERNYNHSQYIKAKKNALDRLEYPSIDFDKIVPWNECDFIRNQYREKMKARLKRK